MATFERITMHGRFHWFAILNAIEGYITVEITKAEFDSNRTPIWFEFLPIVKNSYLRNLCH